MGKSHENLLDVQIMVDKYIQKNDSFFTVSDMHMYMIDWYDVSERTVRRCLDTLEDKGFLQSRKVGNTTVYVVFDEDLLPDAHKIY